MGYELGNNVRMYDVELACIIGDRPATLLNQVHYWLEITSKIDDKDIMAKHYHDGKWWIYNTFEQWHEQFPYWSIITIKRIIAKLEDLNLLISGNYNKYGYDRTKWYTINYDVLNSLKKNHSIKMIQSKVSECHNGKYQNDTTNTIDYLHNTSTKNTNYNNAFFEKQKSVIYSVDYVKRHIDKICTDLGYERYSEDIQHIFEYYFSKYEDFTDRNHPRLSNNNLTALIDKIANGISDIFPDNLDYYEDMIDRHFEIEHGYNIDWNINHFLDEANIDILVRYIYI